MYIFHIFEQFKALEIKLCLIKVNEYLNGLLDSIMFQLKNLLFMNHITKIHI
jgi:hypothetical protein